MLLVADRCGRGVSGGHELDQTGAIAEDTTFHEWLLIEPTNLGTRLAARAFLEW